MYSKAKKVIKSTRTKMSDISKGISESTSTVMDRVVASTYFNNVLGNKFLLSADQKLLTTQILKPGDILLVKTPTFLSNLSLRKATNMMYDHAFVVVDKYFNCVQISFPRAKLTKAWSLVHPSREPLVVRPKISHQNRDRFVEECLSIVGKK